MVGKPWSDIVNVLMEQRGDYVDDAHRMLLKTVDTASDAVKRLEKS